MRFQVFSGLVFVAAASSSASCSVILGDFKEEGTGASGGAGGATTSSASGGGASSSSRMGSGTGGATASSTGSGGATTSTTSTGGATTSTTSTGGATTSTTSTGGTTTTGTGGASTGSGPFVPCMDPSDPTCMVASSPGPIPSCSPTQTIVYTRHPHLFIAVDTSSNVPTAIHTGINAGLKDFFADSTVQAHGISAEVAQFPVGTCNSPTCPSTSGFANPCMPNGIAGISLEPLNAGTANADFIPWASGLTVGGGDSPCAAGLGSALNEAYLDVTSAWPPVSNSTPLAIVVLIMATDPTSPTSHQTCGNSWHMNALAGQAAATYAATSDATTEGVQTFVIWAGSPPGSGEDATMIPTLGAAGFYNNPAHTAATQVESDISAALRDIVTNHTYPCAVETPTADTFSAASATVTASVGGVNTVLANDSTCAGQGWLWSPNPSYPLQMSLCPQSCTSLGMSFAKPTFLSYDVCAAPYAATAVPGISYEGACPAGMKTVWKWLSYDTATPVGASVDFFVQTASMPSPVQVAASTSNQQVCASGMGGGCPVDLVTALDGTGTTGPAFSNTITVSAALSPTPTQQAGPTLNKWQIAYSCQP
jgi:hypothetical protein